MAGSLIKIDEEIVSGAVSSVSLSGIDSTFDVYQVIINNLECDTDGEDLRCRVTEGGTPNTTSNYDRSSLIIRTNSSFVNSHATNNTSWDLSTNIGTGTGEGMQVLMYIFNANNSSEFTFHTKENVEFNSTPELLGQQGGGVFTSASSVDGLNFFMDSGNIDSGDFKLYGLVK